MSVERNVAIALVLHSSGLQHSNLKTFHFIFFSFKSSKFRLFIVKLVLSADTAITVAQHTTQTGDGKSVSWDANSQTCSSNKQKLAIASKTFSNPSSSQLLQSQNPIPTGLGNLYFGEQVQAQLKSNVTFKPWHHEINRHLHPNSALDQFGQVQRASYSLQQGTIREGMLTLSTTAALVEFLSNFNLQVSLV